jgi:hypothetical protein
VALVSHLLYRSIHCIRGGVCNLSFCKLKKFDFEHGTPMQDPEDAGWCFDGAGVVTYKKQQALIAKIEVL